MVRISELPQNAVQHILRRARGRCIAGTSQYARVCRKWRDAEEEAEPLQLFMHLSHLSEADLARATSWLSKHGQTVDVLVVQEYLDYTDHGTAVSAWFVSVVPALHHLRRLEVAGMDTLVGLAPVLQQLPHLQHLAATVHLSYDPKRGRGIIGTGSQAPPGTGSQVPPGTFGKFTNQRLERPWDQVPYMQHLCPQLTSLHLTLQTRERGLRIDPCVSRLVTPQLQQLKLINGASWGCAKPLGLPILCSSSLVHLSALQQLTLDGVVLEEEGSEELAQRLGALQQLHVHHAKANVQGAGALVPLVPKLVVYQAHMSGGDVGVLTSYVHLTRLVLTGKLPEGTGAALAALTGLRELVLEPGYGSSTAEVLQQAAGLAQLRSLQLDCRATEGAASCLAQCTQLTSLVVLGRDTSWLSAVQQLPGLQSVSVGEKLLVCEQGRWLARHTALTQLIVRLGQSSAGAATVFGHEQMTPQQRRVGYHARACSLWQQMAPAVSAGLQHVVFWAYHPGITISFVPMCWQLPASAPGGVQVTAWLESEDKSATGWSRPMRPCPHLPGVWELQGRSS